MLFLASVLSHSGGGTSFDGPWYSQLFNAIVDGFNSIVDGLNTLIEYVQLLIEDFFVVLAYTGYFLGHIPQYLGFLPDVVVSVLILAFGIAVAYMIADRK